MNEAVDIVWCLLTKINIGVYVTNVVGLPVVVPGNYFNYIGLELNSLFPTIVPQGVTELDPIVIGVYVLELPRRDT